jgi:hypothetical protein
MMLMQSEQVVKRVVVLQGSISHEHVKKLANDLASIPNVQVWIEDNYELMISGIPPILKGLGSDLVTYSSGWLRIKKISGSKYTSETVSLTVFFSKLQEKEVERTFKKITSVLPILRVQSFK